MLRSVERAGRVGSAQVAAEKLRREVIGASVLDRARACGDAIPWTELQDFRLLDGGRQRLLDGGGGGIWNPSELLATLSITTSADGPYADRETEAGLLQYHYQKGPEGGKNLKMREALRLGLPLIRFDKVAPGYYHPIFPVFVVGDNRSPGSSPSLSTRSFGSSPATRSRR